MKIPQSHLDFASELTLIKDKAMRLGLYRTAHLLEIPIKEIGWEMQGEFAPEYEKEAQQKVLAP